MIRYARQTETAARVDPIEARASAVEAAAPSKSPAEAPQVVSLLGNDQPSSMALNAEAPPTKKKAGRPKKAAKAIAVEKQPDAMDGAIDLLNELTVRT